MSDPELSKRVDRVEEGIDHISTKVDGVVKVSTETNLLFHTHVKAINKQIKTEKSFKRVVIISLLILIITALINDSETLIKVSKLFL